MGKRKHAQFAEEFNCAICLENHPKAEKKSVKTCRRHYFCEEVMKHHVRTKIADAVVKIRCPSPGCRAYFRDDEVALLVTKRDMHKYKRFQAMRDNENFRECSQCQAGTIDGSLEVPKIICKSCSHHFCLTHGDAHPHTTCTVYENSAEVRSERSEVKIMETTRACPRKACMFRIEKNGGCPEMHCKCGQVSKGSMMTTMK
jgi:hypothetical protein